MAKLNAKNSTKAIMGHESCSGVYLVTVKMFLCFTLKKIVTREG